MKESKPTSKGRILKVSRTLDGYPEIQMDNGPVKVIHIAVPDDRLEAFLSEDLLEIHRHLVTPGKGRFWSKSKPKTGG